VLPLLNLEHRISLGEGWTPLLRTDRLGAQVGLERLYIKDEGVNPTASFKARGMAVAVSRAKELGARKLAVPSPATQREPLQRTLHGAAWRRTSLCRSTRHAQMWSSASRLART